MEEHLKETVNSARISDQLKERDFEQINIITKVQEKAISFPTDSKLYYKMLKELLDQVKERGIVLRYSYKYISKKRQ